MVRESYRVAVILACIGFFSFVHGVVWNARLAAAAEESFTGSWAASGTKDVMPFGENRETALFKLAGYVSLKQAIGNHTRYWAECIGLADTGSGSNGRCVWRAPDGQELYLTLEFTLLARGANVSGIIVGGTGLVEGIRGKLSFAWTTMTLHRLNNSTDIGGYATNMSGSYQLP